MLAAIDACLASALAYTTMSAVDAHARLQQGWFGALVDTRDAGEWAAGHLPNATFVDSLQVVGDTSLLAGCQTCRIAVYCHSGVRSRQAALLLERAGYSEVYDAQGIVQWQSAGFSLVTAASHTPACSLAESQCAWPFLSPPAPPAQPPPQPRKPPPSYPPANPSDQPQTPPPPPASPRPPTSPPPRPPPLAPPPRAHRGAPVCGDGGSCLWVWQLGGGCALGLLLLTMGGIVLLRRRRRRAPASTGKVSLAVGMADVGPT